MSMIEWKMDIKVAADWKDKDHKIYDETSTRTSCLRIFKIPLYKRTKNIFIENKLSEFDKSKFVGFTGNKETNK